MEKDVLFDEELLEYGIAVPYFNYGDDDKLSMEVVAKAKTLPECVVIRLTGFIDEYNYTLFQKRVKTAMSSGFSKIIFDCENLTYISSTGIGSFPTLLNILKHEGGAIVLLRPQNRVYEVFEILGFSRYFPKMNSIEEAIAFLSNPKSDALKEEIFPKVFPCPVCSKKLRVSQPGRFRCTGCQAILSVDEEGAVKA